MVQLDRWPIGWHLLTTYLLRLKGDEGRKEQLIGRARRAPPSRRLIDGQFNDRYRRA